VILSLNLEWERIDDKAKLREFVHVSAIPWSPGDRLRIYDLPGRDGGRFWAALYEAANDAVAFQNVFRLLFGQNSSAAGNIAIEVILETVRAARFDILPSRLSGSFACRTPLDALRFSYHYRLNNPNWYYDVQPQGEVYFADMAFTNKGYQPGLPALQAWQNQRSRAVRYWESVTLADHPNFILGEVLLPGGATVIGPATSLTGPS
jgi:hypothetical protein